MRVAVFSTAPVGTTMSSPAIRAYQLARGLAGEFTVTLVAPDSGTADTQGVEIHAAPLTSRALTRLLRGYDVVVAQKLPPATARRLAGAATRLVFDLYTPTLAESLVSLDAEGADEVARRTAAVEAAWQQLSLAYGDAFICPGERQRDFWLGMLADAGRIGLESYRQDPTLRSLLSVVPFPIPEDPPPTGVGVLRRTRAGVGEDDFVLLWSGGIVNWTDAATPIRAVAQLAERRPDVKLFFLGFRPPDAPPPAEAVRAVELARELGVLGNSVLFQDAWVPYEARQGFLLDADVGVAAYRATFEQRLAFRARLMDYFWAGLPTITTRGDEVGDLVDSLDLGRALDPGDVDGWATAILELAEDEQLQGRIRSNLEPVREQFSLDRALEPLKAILRAPSAGSASPSGRRRLELRAARARALLRVARRSGDEHRRYPSH